MIAPHTPPNTAPHTTSSHSSDRSKHRSSVIGIVLAVIALVLLSWLAWHLTHSSGSAAGGRPGFGGKGGRPATTVGVAVAAQADIPVTLDALGTVNAGATATVHAQVSGVLQKLLFSEGQMVKAGQALAQIDPRQFEISLMQASGQLKRDEAQLEAARLTLERYRTLLGQDSIARQEVDTQQALVKQLEGTVLSDRASEGMARLNLSYSKVVAPISGRIGLKAVDVGNVVSPSDAGGIAVITQVAPLVVEFAVPQDRVPELQASLMKGHALPATAFDRTRTHVLESGQFAALDNQVDVQTGTVRAKASFANAKQTLFPSQFVNIRLLVRTIEGAVVVPVTALRHNSTGDYVYVMDAASHTVALRPVTRGQATVDKVEIAAGLKVGEQVITEGADRLKDGDKVVLPGDKPDFGNANGKRGSHQRPASESASSPQTTPRGAWPQRRNQSSAKSGNNGSAASQ